ncbi:bifunctional cytochrome P450/NADPH--P450 reductase [Sphingomonas endophytica]|uniref:Bifunctional cytochrome P450/NADPH--P450 reductase n=1 Tax=Sphingomonas endophytica TaxID=869719 RepID=A0A147IA47_9SPHN|nr:cytochrome P450 [Sphingomonas endophytica]KTT76677.1 hypothetical protein NS334_00170 [Sphingomonas endophytica]
MTDIPLPVSPTRPLVGSLFELDGNAPVQSVTRLAREHGEIFRLPVLGKDTIVASSQAIVNELCDERRFGKFIHDALAFVRPATGDGLFTAHNYEPNWALAHRVLMPAFGPFGIRGMFDKMLDIARQMFDRWERFGPEEQIDVADSMTRLTLDTLALCAFDYRFNSFYRDHMHPFVDAMVGSLVEASARQRRPAFVTRAMRRTRRKFRSDIAVMHDMADELVADRRRKGIGARGDLLDVMLAGRDGERLSDENIRYQLVTFLIAGHETTSGLLSFAVHLLLDNPAELVRARAHVDAVLGDSEPTLDDLPRLDLIERVLMETLRLWPTAPGFSVTPHEPTTIQGTYRVEPGDDILVLLPALHRDPKVWGDDAEGFRPDRFADGAAERLPPNSWKPFGNGARACIGRGFAMQEAQLVLAMLLQRFDIERTDPGYRLKVAETLTMKPEGLTIRARARGTPIVRPGTASPEPVGADTPPGEATNALLLLHGGNSGTSEAFAHSIARRIAGIGWAATLDTLDAWAGRLPTDRPVVIVTASYEGQPADNARAFVAWLDAQQAGTLDGARIAVLGCGNTQWARTYQAIPKRIDRALVAAGATRLLDRGEVNAVGDMRAAFEGWCAGLVDALATERSTGAIVAHGSIATSSNAPDMLRLPCVANTLLTAPGLPPGRAKRHIVLRLPDDVSYRPGDHLAILPQQPAATVDRALAVLGVVTPALRATLTHEVELERPATPEQIDLLIAAATLPAERDGLSALRNPADYAQAIVAPRTSMIALMERFPSARIAPDAFVAAQPRLTARRYSISSSPLAEPGHCTLTVAVVDEPATGGAHRHLGVASSFLAGLAPGDTVPARIQPALGAFHLPTDPAVPIVMIGAGSGIAPFRGFIAERAAYATRGERVGATMLFFGCRSADEDWLYRDEMTRWVEDGLLDLRVAFSRQPADGVSYVQDLVRRDGAQVAALIGNGAHVYVCGDAARLVPAVEKALVAVAAAALDTSERVARRWCERRLIHTGRYAVDAFA